MSNPIFFAYTALFEVVSATEANMLVEEMLCSAMNYPIHDDAQTIFQSINVPAEPGTYQVWATGTVVFREGHAPCAEVRRSSIIPAPPECLQVLIELAKEEKAAAGPGIEVYTEGEAAVVTSMLNSRRTH